MLIQKLALGGGRTRHKIVFVLTTLNRLNSNIIYVKATDINLLWEYIKDKFESNM